LKWRKRTVLAIGSGLAVVALIVVITLVPRDGDTPVQSESDLNRRLKKLRSVPYTAVTGEKATGESGVVIHKPEKTHAGYNIYCSSLSPEVFLIDMAGEIVHRWTYPEQRKRVWVWAPAVMLDNGDLLVVNKMKSLKKLDWHSNVIWESEMEVHHEVTPLPDGTFYTFVRGQEIYRELQVRFVSIVHVDSEGKEIDRWSTYDHLGEIKQQFDQRAFLDTILDSILALEGGRATEWTVPGHIEAYKSGDQTQYDYFHMNTISLLPETPLGREDNRFKAGNLLICSRNVNQIAILEKDTKEILWVWGQGELQWPHHPTMIDNGNILVFDNGVRNKNSRVLELNPVTRTIEWEYAGDPPESFYSYEKGSAQRFPNGNTLICEGDKGKVFEVTRDGEIVWEWINPVIVKDRRAQVYRMLRLEPGIVEPLLE
jgi:hypothetical protein